MPSWICNLRGSAQACDQTGCLTKPLMLAYTSGKRNSILQMDFNGRGIDKVT